MSRRSAWAASATEMQAIGSGLYTYGTVADDPFATPAETTRDAGRIAGLLFRAAELVYDAEQRADAWWRKAERAEDLAARVEGLEKQNREVHRGIANVRTRNTALVSELRRKEQSANNLADLAGAYRAALLRNDAEAVAAIDAEIEWASG